MHFACNAPTPLQITTPESIEAFITARAKHTHDPDRRAAIVSKFDASPHCEHLRHNRTAYTLAVRRFVDDCTADNNGGGAHSSSHKSSDDAEEDFEKITPPRL